MVTHTLQPFPIRLGDTYRTLIKKLGRPEHDAVDNSLADWGIRCDGQEAKDWCAALYFQMQSPLPGQSVGLSTNLRFQYRRSTGILWSIRILDRLKVVQSELAGVPLDSRIDAWKALLGEPLRVQKDTALLDDYFWIRGDVGYYLEVYKSHFPDLVRSSNAGDTKLVYVCDFRLAPSGLRDFFRGV